MKKFFLLTSTLFVLATTALPATFPVEEDVWTAFRYFEGKWIGKGEGLTGVSTGAIEFDFIFNDRFLKMTNRSVFEPQDTNPSGEVHEDLGLFSYDRERKKYVLRQFHIEGFVNQYVLESLSEDGKTFVFVSEAVENGPPGLKARLTYVVVGPDECRQTFDLAMPGREMTCFMTGTLIRRK